jgi:hypothetical protein
MRQRGIADGWLLLIVLAGISVGLWYAYDKIDQRACQRCAQKVQLEFDKFKADLAKASAQAELIRKGQEYVDAQRKSEADNRGARELDKLRADNKRLRDQARARGPVLPPAAPGAKHPERAPIDRAEFERAYRELAEEVRGVGEEGDKARIGLDTAKRWAQ